MAPVVGMLAAAAFGGRHAHRVALATVAVGLALAVAIVIELGRSGEALQYLLGTWAPPLGGMLVTGGFAKYRHFYDLALYRGGAWEAVGGPGLSVGEPYDATLASAPDGSLYLAVGADAKVAQNSRRKTGPIGARGYG